MEELESQEFTLEDIMREFSGGEPETLDEELNAEEVLQQVLTDESAEQDPVSTDTIVMEPVSTDTIVMEQVSADTIIKEPVSADTIVMEPVSADTIVMEPLSGDTITLNPLSGDTTRMEPVSGDTIVMEPVSGDTTRMEPVSGDTIRMEPIEEEQLEDLTQEPFSEQWEPEYEQPMGDYVPPQPIVFQPQSRLRELKRKLVAGPEKRYYELSEVGMGKLQLAMFLCAVVVALSVLTSVLYATGRVPESRQRLMVFGQLFLMLLAALPGSFQLVDGVDDMFHVLA